MISNTVNSNSLRLNLPVVEVRNHKYFDILLTYVRSGNTKNFETKLEFILTQCPELKKSRFSSIKQTKVRDSNQEFVFNENSRYSLIALLVLIIENYYLTKVNGKTQFYLSTELLNYSLEVLESLPDFKWIDDTKYSENTYKKLPVAETFTFLYNTGLTELAHLFPNYRNKILNVQLNLIYNIIKNVSLSNSSLMNNASKSNDSFRASRILVPILIGLLRSFGRLSGFENKSILTLIFKEKSHDIKNEEAFSQDHFKLQLEKNIQFSSLNVIDYLNPILEMNEKMESFAFNSKLEAYFSTELGANFYSASSSSFLTMSSKEIKDLFQLVKKIFVKNFVSLINNELNDDLAQKNQSKLSDSSYFSFSEVLGCVAISLFKDLLAVNSNNLSSNLRIELKSLIEIFYKIDLLKSSKLSKVIRDDDADAWSLAVNKLLMTINALNIELFYLCQENEADCEKLVLKCIDKIFSNLSIASSILQASLIASCIQILCRSALKYPKFINIVVNNLANFLIKPSPIMLVLSANATEKETTSSEQLSKIDLNVKKSHKVLIFLRELSLDCLCLSLGQCTSFENEPCKNLFSTIDSILGKNQTDGEISSQNSILILSKLAINLKHLKNVQDSVMQLFHKNLSSVESSSSDYWYLEQFGNIFKATNSNTVRGDILNIFLSIILKTNDVDSIIIDLKQLDRYRSVIKVIKSIAENINDDVQKSDLLIRILQIFSQVALKIKNLNQNSQGSKNLNAYGYYLGALVPIICVIAKNISADIIAKFYSILTKLLIDFWYFMLEFNLLDTYLKSVQDLAVVSPVLLPDDQHLTSASLKHEKEELEKIKLTLTMAQPNLTEYVKPLTYTQCSYVRSVIKLETLRLSYLSNSNSYQHIFQYLESEIFLNESNLNVWNCLTQISTNLFNLYIRLIESKANTIDKAKDLENQIQFFLVKLNCAHMKIRNLVYNYLFKLIENFPHLLCSQKTLVSIMDLIEILATNLNTETKNLSTQFKVCDSYYKISFNDKIQDRQEAINNFIQISTFIMKKALEVAPLTTRSHLQSFMLSLKLMEKNFSEHNGISLGLYCLINQSPLDKFAINSSLLKKSEKMKQEFTNFCDLINEKSNYIYLIRNLLNNFNDSYIANSLTKELKKNNSETKSLGFSMLKATSFIILRNFTNTERDLLHEISICCSSYFSKYTIQVAIDCWNWMISSRSDLEDFIIEEMLNAWQMTVESRQGMFSENISEPSPLANEEGVIFKPIMPLNLDAHRLWIKYFHERLDIAKHKNEFQYELFYNLFHKTLDYGDSCFLNKHVSCIGLRFHYLMMAFSMVQPFNQMDSPNLIHKWFLRERIYFAALNYFETRAKTPTQNSFELREDIKYLLEFCNRLCAENKYFKAEGKIDERGLNRSINNLMEISIHTTNLTDFKMLGSGLTSSNYSLADSKKSSQNDLNNNLENDINSSKNLLSTSLYDRLPRTDSACSLESLKKNKSTQSMSLIKKMKFKLKESKRSSSNISLSENSHSKELSYAIGFLKKQNLLLLLMGHELDHLFTFLKPFNMTPDYLSNQIDLVISRSKQILFEQQWAEIVKIAWNISPKLAVLLPTRFIQIAIVKELERLVKSQPKLVTHIPEASEYLATEENILSDARDLNFLLIWEPLPAISVLDYFSKMSQGTNSLDCKILIHPITAQFACKNLMICKPESLLNYIPQLVQSLRYDLYGFVREIIFWLANHSQLLAHQLIWNLKANIYRDQDGKIIDKQIGDLIQFIILQIKESFNQAQKDFFNREFEFFHDITNVSSKIKHIPLGDARKQACEQALKEIKLVSDCYLPSNPDAVVIQILSGTPMQSAAKAPYLARFVVQNIKLSELEELGRTGKKIQPQIELQYKSACIFKVGDDCRQDMLALQVMQLMKNVFEQEGLELFLYPYRVVATKHGCGVIECVPNASSRDQIGRENAIDLYQYFMEKYGGPDTLEFQKARRNFITSMAGYCLFGYLLQIKDRHNGNLLIDNDGHIIHIDFGFMIESSPGGNMAFEPDMKITKEMGLIIGLNADFNSLSFQWFSELCIKGFLAIRPYREQICTIIRLMIDTGLPCFREKPVNIILNSIKSRFQPDLNEREAANYIYAILSKSYNNWRTNTYDTLQFAQNRIYYSTLMIDTKRRFDKKRDEKRKLKKKN